MKVETLTADDVLFIHDCLVREFARSRDPISPPGLKSRDLLESAVARQHVGLGSRLKYREVDESAATLVYGLCCNHPFHNGNKRTALVALFAHLDKNKSALFKVSEEELYAMIVAVATHRFTREGDLGNGESTPAKPNADSEVAGLAKWIYRRMGVLEFWERRITYGELGRALRNFGYSLENQKGRTVQVVRKRASRPKVCTIAYYGERGLVPRPILRRVRRLCSLTEEHGIDSPAFYDYDREAAVSSFMNEHRKVLRRLARS